MTNTDETSWFPEGYEAPKEKSAFMKFEDGENCFRIVSPLVTGYEYWTEENRPVRSRTAFKEIPADIRKDDEGKPTSIKFFWYFLVYNYAEKQVQALEVTQKGIQNGISALVENPKWGNPSGYDITVTKSGKSLETRYSVVPNPHSEITPEIQKEIETTDIKLEAIFE